jgi:hypothetical protein
MLPAVQALASAQAHPTERVMEAAKRLLQYAVAYPEQQLEFKACDMVLYIQSDASYLSRSNSRSVAGGILYLGNKESFGSFDINGPILAVSTLIRCVVSSAAEAEYGACFINAQHGVWLRTVLEAMGYKQPATSLICDNKCAVGLGNATIKQKRSKSIDMRFHWVRDRIKQGQFKLEWVRGAGNVADFFTKPLSVEDHRTKQVLLMRNHKIIGADTKIDKNAAQSVGSFNVFSVLDLDDDDSEGLA